MDLGAIRMVLYRQLSVSLQLASLSTPGWEPRGSGRHWQPRRPYAPLVSARACGVCTEHTVDASSKNLPAQSVAGCAICLPGAQHRVVEFPGFYLAKDDSLDGDPCHGPGRPYRKVSGRGCTGAAAAPVYGTYPIIDSRYQILQEYRRSLYVGRQRRDVGGSPVLGVGFGAFWVGLDDLQTRFEYGRLRLTLLVSVIVNNFSETSFLRGTHSLWFVFLLMAINLPAASRGKNKPIAGSESFAKADRTPKVSAPATAELRLSRVTIQ